MGVPGEVVWIPDFADASGKVRVFDSASSGEAFMAQIADVPANRRGARASRRFAGSSSHHKTWVG